MRGPRRILLALGIAAALGWVVLAPGTVPALGAGRSSTAIRPAGSALGASVVSLSGSMAAQRPAPVVRPTAAGAAERVRERGIVVGVTRGRATSALRAALAAMSATITGGVPQIGALRVELPAGLDPARARRLLARIPGVRYAEPVLVLHAVGPSGAQARLTPNDPNFLDQWGLGRAQFDDAWGTSTGNGQVIAIIDSGADIANPDLAPSLWPGPGGTHGRCFVPTLAETDIADRYGHGTHVAGIAAAATNNGIYGAGGAPGAKVMILKALDDHGNGDDPWVAAAITWAVDHGAHVINMSLSGTGPSIPTVMDEACRYARDRGAVIVAALGNENTSDRNYPAGDYGVIAAAATDRADDRASFSNYGAYKDMVSAPGVDIASTLPMQFYNIQALDPGLGLGFGRLSGTSMSTPFICALAALIRSQNPGMDATQTVARIEQTADPVGARRFYGSGRINAMAALGGLSKYPPLSVLDPREPNDTIATAKSTLSTSPADAYLFPEGDRDMWAVDAAVSGHLLVTMRGGNDLDPAIALLDSSGATIAVVDQARTGGTETLARALADPGRYYVVAYDAFGGWSRHAYGFSLSFSSDRVPPKVSITSPVTGAYVRGIVTVKVKATDDLGVGRVEYTQDGVGPVFSATASPFAFAWDSRALASGSSHTLSAVAVDRAGNRSGPSTVRVTVDNDVPVVPTLYPSTKGFSPNGDGVRDVVRVYYGFRDAGSPTAKVRLTVLGPSGRQVRDLGTRAVARGTHSLLFDGRDSRRRLLPAGWYKIRCAATDLGGLTSRARFAWVVIDTVRPAISSAAAVRTSPCYVRLALSDRTDLAVRLYGRDWIGRLVVYTHRTVAPGRSRWPLSAAALRAIMAGGSLQVVATDLGGNRTKRTFHASAGRLI